MIDLAGVAGRMVAVPLGAVARARHGRPMHPRGVVLDAVLQRTGSAPAWGVPWLDERRQDDVVVRLPRGAGLPTLLPDLLGLALRVPGDGGPIDLLLTSAGRTALGRLLPVPRRDTATSYGSIMGYRSEAGLLRFAAVAGGEPTPSEPAPLAAAVPREGLEFSLRAARGLGPWRPFARLTVAVPRDPLDCDLRFDAVLNPPPGLVPDGPLARFRRPAYARARAEGHP